MNISESLRQQIIIASRDAYPEEMCGVVISGEFIRLDNVSKRPQEHFEMDPKGLARLEDRGEIEAYVHSHPDGTAIASALDKHQIELHGKTWIICAYPAADIQTYEPCGYQAPLVGRLYHHGWQDCYALIRDFYSREMGIELLDFERDDRWWEAKDHASLYVENYAKTGFIEVDQPQYGDVLLCNVGRTEHPNHALIWLGEKWQLNSEDTEPCYGNTLFLHHPYHQSSKREIYGPNWLERTVKVLRHKAVMHV